MGQSAPAKPHRGNRQACQPLSAVLLCSSCPACFPPQVWEAQHCGADEGAGVERRPQRRWTLQVHAHIPRPGRLEAGAPAAACLRFTAGWAAPPRILLERLPPPHPGAGAAGFRLASSAALESSAALLRACQRCTTAAHCCTAPGLPALHYCCAPLHCSGPASTALLLRTAGGRVRSQ